MKLLALAAAALLTLAAGCTPSTDAAIRDNLPKVCSGASIAHTAFTAVAAAGSIPAKTVRREAIAWAALEPLCANPGSQTTASVLVAAAQSYAVITAALADAKRVEGGGA
ncbi:cell wall anchor protein [Escherichia coli]|nr:cell wall anchor protein [Escherichia coli]